LTINTLNTLARYRTRSETDRRTRSAALILDTPRPHLVKRDKLAVGALFCETPLLAAAECVIDRFLARDAASAKTQSLRGNVNCVAAGNRSATCVSIVSLRAGDTE